MRKIRLKIFKSGNYPQGDFSSVDKLKDIIKNTKENIKAQFAHTSKLKKEPVIVGEFSNLGLEGDEVYADFEFNDTGKDFYDKGIIEGLSVEIKDNRFDRVAALPVGVNPAIVGAEFAEQHGFYIEFEKEEIKEPIKEEKEMNLKDELAKLSAEERTELFAEFEEKPEPKTEAEIRAELVKEFELKATEDRLKSKLDKVQPALKKIVEFAIEKACTVDESSMTYEFEKDGETAERNKITEFEEILEGLKMPTGNVSLEFGKMEKKEKTQDDYKKIAEELTK